MKKKKKTLKFRIQNCYQGRIQENPHFPNSLNCIENFPENDTEALLISKRLEFS